MKKHFSEIETIGLTGIKNRAKLGIKTIGARLSGNVDKRLEVAQKRTSFWGVRQGFFTDQVFRTLAVHSDVPLHMHNKRFRASCMRDASENKQAALEVQRTKLLDTGFEV